MKKWLRKVLNKLIKDSELSDSNMSQETKQAIASFEANPTVENRIKAEKSICRNGADNNLVKLCQKIKTEIEKGNLSKKKQQKLINEIQVFISKNTYQKMAYQNNQQALNALLDKLSN